MRMIFPHNHQMQAQKKQRLESAKLKSKIENILRTYMFLAMLVRQIKKTAQEHEMIKQDKKYGKTNGED